MTIINPDLVQYPEVFITQKMAIESIIKHVSQGPQYVYDDKTDIIEIKYKMFDTHGICLQLKKDLTNIPTIEQRITRLELLLDTLTLDELIESHTYPSWSTYEEFMKLPGYKYFDAFHNAQRYFNSEPMVHLGKFQDIYYVLQWSPHILNMANTRTSDPDKKAALSALADYAKPCHITQNKDVEQKSKDINFYSTMYKQPAGPQGQINTNNFRDYFHQSLKTFLYRSSSTYRPCQVIAEYLRMYIFGFYLLNHQILFGREVRIELHQLGDKITLHIFRSKKIIVVHKAGIDATINLTIPEIKNIKVDGVYVEHLGF
jgi:hypothetical protein